ncbi:hypothetical protein GCM10027589_43890 [Actinocorallia lasiicapitis]
MTEVVIGRRFNGPPESGNGGYVSGVLAAASGLGGAPVVTLRLPPPLETPILVEPGPNGMVATAGGSVIATIAAGTEAIPVVPFVPLETALECEKAFTGDVTHPFPTCFACGPDHAEGLRLRPGFLPGKDRATACVWTPEESTPELVWAALDCPGGWTDTVDRVLGRMSAEIHALPEPGVPHILVAAADEPNGRKLTSRVALYTTTGDLLATAAQTWISLTR